MEGKKRAEEKRDFTRIPFGVRAEMRAGGRLYRSEGVTNLSVGGCLLPISVDLAPRTSCEVRIFMSGMESETSVKALGEIVRRNDGAVAVRFCRMDSDSRFHLQNIIRYNADDPESVEREILIHPFPD